MSKTYRFQTPTNLPLLAGPSILRKRRRGPRRELRLLAADASSITDASGTRPIESYQENRSLHSVVLTRKEADLIALANPGARPPSALEVLFPWLPHRPFINSSPVGYKLVSSVVRRYGQHFESAAELCDRKWNTICNAVRRKSDLDARFFTAWHLPIQDAYVLEENRPDRSVVAIDFNAMYSACMQHAFPKPAALRHVHWDRPLEAEDDLQIGLYRCVLSAPSNFIRRHNPFRSFCLGRHFLASLDEPVEVDLNEFEIAYYRRHFGTIHVVDGVVSDENVQHPLAKEAVRSFARRRSYRAQGNKALADREKYLSTLLSSCANRPTLRKNRFRNGKEAMEHLRRVYGIRPLPDEPEVATDAWLRGRSNITVRKDADGTVVIAPEVLDQSACFLFGQRIVAKGRVILLEMMEAITANVFDAQICYSNVDSIHFSLPTRHLEGALVWLKTKACERMGAFKIEAVSDHGLWLEPGRYWLYSKEIEKFRNRGIRSGGNPFKDHAIHVASRRIGNLHIPIRVGIHMQRTMCATRALEPASDGGGLVHQRLIAIADDMSFASVLDAIERNRTYSVPDRISAFQRLKKDIGNPCPAASGQG